MSIPKIIHQIWIGPLDAPLEMMKTWKDKHPDFEYIFWNEAEIEKRNMVFNCQSKIDIMKEINGQADIMRWEILYQYGGYFVDADSICIEPFDDYFNNKIAFATYENEVVRDGLIATGTMGFIPNHRLCGDIIDWINTEEFDEMNKTVRAWATVGPGLLTRFLKTGNYKDFSVYPSHCFLPIHFTGLSYKGHKKVYAYQAWGTANKNYDKMNSMDLPPLLREPNFYISILLPVYNTNFLYLKECFESIKCQNGYFGIELVCVNDGSDAEHSDVLEAILDDFIKKTRFCKVIYEKFETNMGIRFALNKGVELCNNELIFRMDADDIMLPDRINNQIEFIKNNPSCVMLGTNMRLFKNDDPNNLRKKSFIGATSHPSQLTWEQFLQVTPDWSMNHPSLCFRKSAVLTVGNYNKTGDNLFEDFELELKIMKKYGAIYNLPAQLIYYRSHQQQLTNDFDSTSPEMVKLRKKIIEDIMSQ
jgi:mannosyltransferase OCH1-like enzyme